MSDLRVNSIAGRDGTSPATLVKQSAAKALANLNGTGTIALRDSFNVSSIVDEAVGSYTRNFTNNFSDTNYVTSGICANIGATNGFVIPANPQSASSRRNTMFSGTDAFDTDHFYVSDHGDLA